ncbi:carboxymuconolactone decarboxylase family protein [Flavobacterium psychrotrophum]|uniref:carboxymuconolactone decarboxylase family protein n=1 Tax=Flavobacterium psychrotrophum TaxID=2294119 RepID=UPI000E3184A3|nr:carboxymuconolactone decarboxylase family protein [Flavobacterium psychrotrophum]
MSTRVKIAETTPNAWKAMYALSVTVESGLSKTHKELLKIRTSQINGCAFCLDMHTKDALKYGETAQRIFLLNAWKESGLFTEEEKVVLAIAEEIALIHNQGLTETTYKKALEYFTEEYIANIIMAAVTINAWNRIAISTEMPVPGV